MQLKSATALGLFVTLSLLLVQPALANQDLVCESKDYRYQYCPIADHGYVEMTRQLSRESCVQGQTWDWDRNGVWVDDGCRAQFHVESEVHKDHHKAAKAAGVVLGAALLGALIDNADHDDKYKYTDERYQGPRHRSYVPRWMVGRFEATTPTMVPWWHSMSHRMAGCALRSMVGSSLGT